MKTSSHSKLLILTENPAGIRALFRRVYHRVARFAKKVLFHLYRSPRLLPYGGPDAVAASLYRGLTLRGVAYSVNQRAGADTVCVLADPDALRYAIRAKEAGVFKKIIAGPNVVHNPNSEGGLIRHSAIDAIVVPSQWNKDWWLSIAPELAPRLHAWPAGVSDAIPPSSKTGGVVVYSKNPCPFIDAIISAAGVEDLSPRLLRYGTFTHAEYLDALKDARAVVYLSQTESQGIALSEAWMADVPTLVWNPGFFNMSGFSWKDPAMSAPYASPQTGAFFADQAEFDAVFAEFIRNPERYSPRAYCIQNLSDQVSTALYLKIAGLS